MCLHRRAADMAQCYQVDLKHPQLSHPVHLQAGGADQAAAALWTPANGVEMRREPGSRKTRGTSGRSTAGEAAARSEQYSASISG